MAKSASKSARKRTTKPSAGSEPDVTAQARPARKNGAKAAKAPPAPAPAPKDEPLEPAGTIFVGQSVKPERILLGMSNRHGLATGATGTGKTVTLQVLAEGFSRNGVPVFAADIKGDLSGICMAGEAKPFLVERAQSMALDYEPDAFPTIFWDLFGEQGHPIRATVSEMGPLLLARLLDLNDVQEGVLNVAFKIADDSGLQILDFKDLRTILDAVAPFASKKEAEGGTGNPDIDAIKRAVAGYGNVTKQTVGTIQRALLVLENQGGEKFFGEPALDLKDFMKTDRDGRGYVNILAADKLMGNPRLYATFLLWLLSELFEELPEVGDPEKPKLVFFFDEAHLLFDEAPKALLEKIEQVVRLVRSKGVGVYFVTQNPLDVPDKVLAQLGNRVQHALRAFTPRDQKAVQTAATTFRPNPKLNTAQVIMELGKGEALVSFLEAKGTPSMVERCMIRPPSGRMGPITPAERAGIIAKSPLRGKYDTTVDRESAYEKLGKRVAREAAPAGQAPQEQSGGGIGDWIGSIFGTNRKRGEKLTASQAIAREVARTVTGRVVGGVAASIGKQIGGSAGASVGRAIVRGTLGGILRR
jgi:DNA helicase HerA-like ATPase